MSGVLIGIGVGVLLAYPVALMIAKLLDLAFAAVKKRLRRPASPYLSVLQDKLARGQRISIRRIFATQDIRGRSWALVLFKQGPNEPFTEFTEFTEPLDDEEAGE